ncbi:hypothetical protein roselon_02450 [Roseibacterium elongatum DSM 19469]|uniref:Uncharacterized protein n=1 Tax=Roseicyclus elongatus DSM 19469 TaxID=1294273 RepID=W8RU66_9RHOB|nr:hypothetical protein roselon_02450 [Roseibacterium elongatum DSM 19469]
MTASPRKSSIAGVLRRRIGGTGQARGRMMTSTRRCKY